MCQRSLTSPAESCVSHCMLGAIWRSENTSWNASLKRSVVSGLLQYGNCLQGPYQYRLIPIHLVFQGILHFRFLHVGNISPLKSLSCISQEYCTIFQRLEFNRWVGMAITHPTILSHLWSYKISSVILLHLFQTLNKAQDVGKRWKIIDAVKGNQSF